MMPLFSLCGVALASSWWVPDDGTLQEVLTLTEDGDDVTIAADWRSADSEVLDVLDDVTITGDSSAPASLPPMNVDGVTVSISNALFPWVAEQDAYYYDDGDEPVGLRVYAADLTLDHVAVSGTEGIAIYAEDSDVRAVDCDFSDHVNYAGIFHVVTYDTHTLTLTGGTLQDNDVAGMGSWSPYYGVANVVVDGTTFTNNGSDLGNGVWLVSAVAAFTDTTFEDTVWDIDTTAIYAENSALVLDGVTFTNIRGGPSTDVISVLGSLASLDARDVTLTWPGVTSDLYTAIYAYDAIATTIDGLRIDGALTQTAPVLLISDTANLNDVVIMNSAGLDAGAVSYSLTAGLTLQRARFCSNTGTASDAAGAVYGIGDATVTGSIFGDNYGEGGIFHLKRGMVAVTNVDFVSNKSAAGSVYSGSTLAYWALQNTIFVREELAISSSALRGLTASYNLWFGNVDDGIGSISSDDVVDDPMFDPGFDPSDCDTYPELLAGSPAIDAGYGGPDPDGSVWDMGAMSGATPLTAPPVDDDSDGYVSAAEGGDDCDDDDATIHPAAPEIPYDGVDQDCSGSDLVDVDGDGYTAVEVGGTDCDDTDALVGPCDSGDTGPDDTGVDDTGPNDTGPSRDRDGDGYTAAWAGGDDCNDGDAEIHPNAWDDPETATDEDCDGANATLSVGGACGCGSTRLAGSGVGSVAVVALGGLLFAARRRTWP